MQHAEHLPRITEALGSLRVQHPDLRVRIEECKDAENLKEAVRRGSIDIGFGVDFINWVGVTAHVFDLEYALLVPIANRQSPIANRQSPTASQLGITVTTADRAIDDRMLVKLPLTSAPTEQVLAARKGGFGPLERALVEAVAVGSAVPVG